MSGNNGCPNDENDYEIGVREERARVVSWLRMRAKTHLFPRSVNDLADAIAKGVHTAWATSMRHGYNFHTGRGPNLPANVSPLNVDCHTCGAAIGGLCRGEDDVPLM